VTRRVFTRAEWFVWIAEAWADVTCPMCGYSHGEVEVESDGTVALYCPRHDRTFAVGREYMPEIFAPDPDDGGDLPF